MNLSKRIKIFLTSLLLLLLPLSSAYAASAAKIYAAALRHAKAGNTEAAFMYFHLLQVGYPDSEYEEEALFAAGEYYFLISDYYDSIKLFIKLLNKYPDTEGKPIALLYLLKIAEIRGEEIFAKNLEKSIVTFRRLILLFKDTKEYEYKSPLGRIHKLVYYIDRIESYVDGELFAEIPY